MAASQGAFGATRPNPIEHKASSLYFCDPSKSGEPPPCLFVPSCDDRRRPISLSVPAANPIPTDKRAHVVEHTGALHVEIKRWHALRVWTLTSKPQLLRNVVCITVTIFCVAVSISLQQYRPPLKLRLVYKLCWMITLLQAYRYAPDSDHSRSKQHTGAALT